MPAAYPPRSYSADAAPRQARCKPVKADDAAKSRHPVQLTIFDYAAAIGVTLMPDAS